MVNGHMLREHLPLVTRRGHMNDVLGHADRLRSWPEDVPGQRGAWTSAVEVNDGSPQRTPRVLAVVIGDDGIGGRPAIG